MFHRDLLDAHETRCGTSDLLDEGIADTFVQWIRLRVRLFSYAPSNRTEATMASANRDFLDFSGKAVLITGAATV